MAKIKKQGKALKRSQFKLSEKSNIIERVENEMSRGVSMRKVSKDLGISQSTLRGIVKKKDIIMDKLEKFPKTNDSV